MIRQTPLHAPCSIPTESPNLVLVGVEVFIWLVCHMVLLYDLKIYIRLGGKLYMIITQ